MVVRALLRASCSRGGVAVGAARVGVARVGAGWAAVACLALACGPRAVRFDDGHLPSGPDGVRNAEPAAFTPEDDITPSASLDGRFLAFASELNGNLDIWVRDRGTNSTYPITRDTAEDFDPALAPDGEHVAFVSRRLDAKGDLYLASIRSIEDHLERLTDKSTADRQPAFSPDGERIYYTAAAAGGADFVRVLELASRESRRISPTPGFDPAPSPDGRYLVYTAPPGAAGGRYPRLVALRLADSATRALTAGDAPEGFARFVDPAVLGKGARQGLVYVRFPDDDDGNGVLDANDQSSLWRLDLDLDALFAVRRPPTPPTPAAQFAPATPFPLTDGTANELFPAPASQWLYFTQGDTQQDIMRLPIGGMFPDYAEPEQYAVLAESVDAVRTRWFAYRCVLARTAPDDVRHARALLRIANLQLERDRPDLARVAFTTLEAVARTAPAPGPRAELRGVAEAELASIDRRVGLQRAATEVERTRTLDEVRARLDELARTFAWSDRVRARVALELAELDVGRGDRSRAIAAFEEVVRAHPGQPFSAARAMLREIDLLGVAHDPDALGEAYTHVLTRFPAQADAVRAAAERIVDVQLESLDASGGWRAQVDALRRLIPRFGDSPVRTAARWRLVRILLERGVRDDAALELERIVAEAGADRASAARALMQLAEVDEARGQLDAALTGLFEVRSKYTDLPGYTALARDGISRVGARKAAAEESRGDKLAARAVYKGIIDNDLNQVKAHRRYLALSAATGTLDEAIAEARARAERSPRTPMARYAYGLALTWKDPPALDAALTEVDEALRLNPKLLHALITRGWINEMKDAERPGPLEAVKDSVISVVNGVVGNLFSVDTKQREYLQKALAAYAEALRLNSSAEDPETQAEIWLNDGNASYSLGVKTNNITNLEQAFNRYVAVLRSGYRFSDPRAELVFWERFGRAAAWNSDWATSVMATRRAIALARKLGDDARLGQLLGNLALAYGQADEDEYAREATAEATRALEDRGLGRRLTIARRNRAVARLEAVENRTPENLDEALADLAGARRGLPAGPPRRADARGVRRPEPEEDTPIWRSVGPDGSSAQYGFRDLNELDLELALGEMAHRGHGEASRAEALAARREGLWTEAQAAVPKKFGTVPWAPTTLLQLREKLGLDLALARARFSEGRPREAGALLDAAGGELTAWIADEQFVNYRPSLQLDRGRLAAVRAELAVAALEDAGAAGAAGLGDPGAEIERALPAVAALAERGERAPAGRPATTAAAPEDEVLKALPATFTSTEALAVTASVALAPPRLAGLALEARAVAARLHADRGRLALVRGARLAASPSPADRTSVQGTKAELGALLAALDAGAADLRAARADLEVAARLAAGAGPGLGARVLALALAGVGWASRRLGDRDPALVRATFAHAAALARSAGRPDLALAIALEDALGRGAAGEREAFALVSRIPPALHGQAAALVEIALARSASAALARNDLPGALQAIDRWMLIRSAARANVSLARVAERDDRDLGRRFSAALGRLDVARRALAGSDADTAPQAIEGRLLQVRSALDTIDALRKENVSDAARARLFAEPVLLDLLTDQVAPDELLIAAVPIAGVLHLLAVDGSTVAVPASKIRHAVSARGVAEILGDVERLRAALARDQAPPPEIDARLGASLFAHFGAQLAGKRKIILADGLLGGPLPVLAPAGGSTVGIAITHVSAPSVAALEAEALLVGVSGSSAVARAADPPLAPTDLRITEDTAMAFRAGRRARASAPERTGAPASASQPTGAPASAPARPSGASVEALAERARAAVVIEAPLALEPAAPERSAIRLGVDAARPSRGEVQEAALTVEPDRFEGELPLEDLDLPARVLVLARVEAEVLGHTLVAAAPEDELALDQVLAARGTATIVAIPDLVPRPAAARVTADVLARAAELGPARALAEAVARESRTTPSARLIAVLGAPGLDRAGTRLYARRALRAAKERANNLFRKDKIAQAAVAIKRWTRLALEAGEDRDFLAAQAALVAVLSDRLPKPEPARAAEEQRELVAFLERRAAEQRARTGKADAAAVAAIASARIDLGRHLSAAHQDDEAEATLTAAAADLERLGDRLGVARAQVQLALHLEDRRHDFRRAAAALERAIELYEREKAYDRKPPPLDAVRALTRVGTIYLNRLSDSLKAQAAFERAFRRAQSERERNDSRLSLARVARRRGAFADAADLVAEARRTAAKSGWSDQEAEAAIEGANVAWYRGDYRLGQDLCGESLALVDKIKAEGANAERARKKKRIFALSVCGLVAMSRREFDGAISILGRARRIAQAIDDQPEIATQDNNLGRVYLEFGQLDQAIEAFQGALAIDRALDDHFALAYDLRNLGTALLYKGEAAEAERDLQQALTYALEVQDANNELRVRFSLGELLRTQGRNDLAIAQYTLALPLAERYEVRDLAWQIHRAMGLLAESRGDRPGAERELRLAVSIVRSITGRAESSDFGPQRYAAFDELMALLLTEERVREAFQVADLARSLEELELLDDPRIRFANPAVPGLLQAARVARTATAAAEAFARLAAVDPRLAELLRPASLDHLEARIPEDAAVVAYRVADDQLVTFVIDRRGFAARRIKVTAAAVREQVREYGRQMTARADVLAASAELSKVLIAPVSDLIAGRRRLVFVPHKLLRYVAFPALPVPGVPRAETATAGKPGPDRHGGPRSDSLLDRFVLLEALDLESAVLALAHPLGPLAGAPITAFGDSAPGAGTAEAPLPFATKEIASIREEYPEAGLISGGRLTRGALRSAFAEDGAVVHFAGHTRVGASEEGRASYIDPLGGELATSDGGLSLLEVLGTAVRARLVVLSACSTMLARTTPGAGSPVSGDELLSLAESFQIAGAGDVLATTMHVSDVAAAMVMKRFYRAARRQDAAAALREAELAVRELYPHPAWWATFTLIAR